MKATIGIDIGGSTTKIVGFRHTAGGKELIHPLFVRSSDPVTSVYGAFGKFTAENGLAIGDIDRVYVTGVGSYSIKDNLYTLPCTHVDEFPSIGRGGLYLTGLERAVVISLGTGTAGVFAERGKSTLYLGGTGIGGGTLVGLSKLLLKMDSVDHVVALAEKGNLSNIDLRIGDIMRGDRMPSEMTAANFGNVSDIAKKEDIALGILNMIYETVTVLAVAHARAHNVRDVILTGRLSCPEIAKRSFAKSSGMFGVNFIIPKNSGFATVIGAALSEEDA